MPALVAATEAIRRGDPLLLYDGDHREAEVDLFVPAWAATPDHVARLRRDAGGLVFVALDHAYADAVALPMLEDLFRTDPTARALVPERLPYDARSAFSLTINHRNSFTGVTDRDRALTIRVLGELVLAWAADRTAPAAAEFVRAFRAPGHVHLCVARPGLLEEREGHTELAVALAHLAGLPGCLVGAEMLQAGDGALPLKDAQEYARRHGFPLVHRDEVVTAWRSLEIGQDAPKVSP